MGEGWACGGMRNGRGHGAVWSTNWWGALRNAFSRASFPPPFSLSPIHPLISKAGHVFHRPRVKSGKATGRLPAATERPLSSTTALSAAAS